MKFEIDRTFSLAEAGRMSMLSRFLCGISSHRAVNVSASIDASRGNRIFFLFMPGCKATRRTMRASLFITCYNDTLFPDTGRAAVRVLERLGVEVEINPAQTCCGQLHANTGFRGEAYSQAKRFVLLYRDAECI